MIKRMIFVFSTLFFCCFFYLFFYNIKNQDSKFNKKKHLFNQEEIKNISRYLAHLLGNDLKVFIPYYDFDEIVRILSEIEHGQAQPLSSEDCYIALKEFEYKILEEDTRKNLENINQFLSQLAMRDNVVEVDKGKLYYETIQKGLGTIVTEISIPLIHFTEYNLLNTVLQDTRNKEPRRIVLRETIPGFLQGVVGMQIGERRKIYVHPDLAYGKLAKNLTEQLIIFDVEIIDVK